MRKYTVKVGMLALGWFFILFGIVGLFLPFLQGIIFLTIGALILSRHSLWFEKKIALLKIRYPRFALVMAKVEGKYGDWTKQDARATHKNKDPLERDPESNLPTIR